MKTILLTLPLLLLGTACATPQRMAQPSLVPQVAEAPLGAVTAADTDADIAEYFAAADESPAFASSPSDSNTLRVLVGGTTDRGGGGFTLGGQFEHRITTDWGAGAFADITFGDKRTVFDLGGGAFWHPVENLSLLGGVGFDFKNDDVFARVGGSYDFEMKQLKLGPALYVDLGAKGTPIMAALMFSFDF